MITDAQRKMIDDGLKRGKLLAPKEVIFPDKVQFGYKPNTDELRSVINYLEKNFSKWLGKLETMPTTDPERKKRKEDLVKYVFEQNERYRILCTPENYLLNVAHGKSYIAEWESYPLDMAANCRRESINNLELIISKIDRDRTELRSLYHSYIDKIKNSVLTPTLKAGNYNHKEIFNRLVADKIIIKGNFDSWNSFFVGADFSDRKKITIDVKRRTEFLYFIKLYCPEFDKGTTRKIKELKEIIVYSDGVEPDSNYSATTNNKKIKKIQSFFY